MDLQPEPLPQIARETLIADLETILEQLPPLRSASDKRLRAHLRDQIERLKAA